MEWVINAFRQAGIDRILVVVGSHLPELARIVEANRAVALLLGEPSPDMRTTIERGLDWAERHWEPQPDEGWFLCPGDHPAISSRVIEQLRQMWLEPDRASSILIPTYQGKRGHPSLIGWEHVPHIRRLAPNVGLNRYLRDHAAVTREIPVEEPGVLTDLDTPEDYDRFVDEVSGGELRE